MGLVKQIRANVIERIGVMKKILVMVVLLLVVFLAGCESLRFAPSQEQKENAWLHSRTTIAAAQEAEAENTSEKLQWLTELSELQSRAFTSYYGLPKRFPATEDLLAESNFQLGRSALQQSVERPDAFAMAGSLLEVAIGVSALIGGVYGTKAFGFLQQAKQKSRALKEVIAGNELFKTEHGDSVTSFKQAHRNQSPVTRQIVAGMKA